MKTVARILLVLVVWGMLKGPWEDRLSKERSKVTYGEDLRMSFALRETVGQNLALAALGGFRGLVATYLWISLTEAWEEQTWTRVRTLADFAVTLQPRVLFFWENGAWHLAWNASVSVSKYAPEGTSEARKDLESRRWIDAGIDMLERGIQAIPEKPTLYLRMAELYWQRLEDFDQAAHYYRLAEGKPGAPSYVPRFIGYALEKAGRLEESLNHWKMLESSDYYEGLPPKQKEKVQQERAKLEKLVAEAAANPAPKSSSDDQ
ncbi:MAG: tetratricopeptide repeat protein [Candidatus Methylacidiphilales bacterium]